MRLLYWNSAGSLSLTEALSDSEIPAQYAILSHTWSLSANDEVTFADLHNLQGKDKDGYQKLKFCGEQAKKDGIKYFWVDTCCINTADLTELSEAITSMFRWYSKAERCYVFLSDVSARKRNHDGDRQHGWESSFRTSRWFQRGWTLQELLAPSVVEFFSREQQALGSKEELAQQISHITEIPLTALQSKPLSQFSIAERLRWAEKRKTKKPEDRAYCLLGIFDVSMPLIYGEGDKAWVRLQEEIQKRNGGSSAPAHFHWVVPRTPNPLFTGRADLLENLENLIRNRVNNPLNQAPCQIVVSGIGGQGKSELSLQLARRLRSVFWAVLWVDVSSPTVAEQSFMDVASKLTIPAQRWEDAIHGIANLTHPWLLILDNADDLDVDYQVYFPEGALGTVIMTTRNEECQHYGTDRSLGLTGLEVAEARELLLKAIGLWPDKDGVHNRGASAVASLLQSHPLALVQAAAYISRGHCTLSEYPNLYERQRKRLLTFRPTQARSRYRDVYATFEVSAAALAATNTQASQDALDLLAMLAVGAPNHLPVAALFKAAWQRAKRVPLDRDDYAEDELVELLTPWHVARLPPFVNVKDNTWDDFHLTEALALLKAFSLVSFTSVFSIRMLSMHPLIHAWSRDRLDKLQQQQTWLRVECVLAFALHSHVLTEQFRRSLQTHVEAFINWDLTKMVVNQPPVLVARVLVHCGWLLHALRADAKLDTLLQKLFSHLMLGELVVDQSYLGLYILTARNAIGRGKGQISITLLEQIVTNQQERAEEDLLRLNSQHWLAIAYLHEGYVKEAVMLLKHVVKIREQILAEEHPDRLASQHALAKAYLTNMQVQEAVVLFEYIVEVRQRTLAEDDPDRLHSQRELASAYRHNRQVKEATTLLEHVVKIEEQTLAEEHPDRLTSQHELARAYLTEGQVRGAITLFEHVVKVKKQILAQEHPSLLQSQQGLAMAYQENGQVQEAVGLNEHVVKIKEQTMTQDHFSRLRSQHELARAYHVNGQVQEAVVLLEHVVKMEEQTLAKDHPDRLSSQQVLAIIHWERGDQRVAYKMMKEIVEQDGRIYDEGHPIRNNNEEWLAIMEETMKPG